MMSNQCYVYVGCTKCLSTSDPIGNRDKVVYGFRIILSGCSCLFILPCGASLGRDFSYGVCMSLLCRFLSMSSRRVLVFRVGTSVNTLSFSSSKVCNGVLFLTAILVCSASVS